jgi:regulator of replication initiation timing
MLGAMQGFDSLQNPEYDSVDLEDHLKNALLHWTDLTLEQPNIFRQRLETNAENHPLVTELSTEAEREESLAQVFQTTLNECLDEVAREREDCLKRLINMFKLWSKML